MCSSSAANSARVSLPCSRGRMSASITRTLEDVGKRLRLAASSTRAVCDSSVSARYRVPLSAAVPFEVVETTRLLWPMPNSAAAAVSQRSSTSRWSSVRPSYVSSRTSDVQYRPPVGLLQSAPVQSRNVALKSLIRDATGSAAGHTCGAAACSSQRGQAALGEPRSEPFRSIP
eukprot:935644-Prymnesium_polylepis.1